MTGRRYSAPPDGSEEQSRLAHVAMGGPRAFGCGLAIRQSRARPLSLVGQLLLRAVVWRDRAQPQPLPHLLEPRCERPVRQLALDLLRLSDVRLDPDA